MIVWLASFPRSGNTLVRLRWPRFFRSGVAESWVRDMSDELHDLFWMHHGETMEWLGYQRHMAAGDAAAGPCLT